MKDYQKYLEEKLMDMYSSIKGKGMYVFPEYIDEGLVALWKKLTGEEPTDEDLKPFFVFMTQGAEKYRAAFEKAASEPFQKKTVQPVHAS